MTLSTTRSQNTTPGKDFYVNITRQTIASLVGLRVETVIRAIRELKSKGQIKTKNRKIYL